MAKEVKNVRYVLFEEDPSTFPVLSVISLFKNSHHNKGKGIQKQSGLYGIGKPKRTYVSIANTSTRKFKPNSITEQLVDLLDNAIIGDLDMLDVQDELIDMGLDKAAKL